MNLWFLPFVREGITPSAAAAGRGQAQVSVRVSAPGRTPRDVSRRIDLLGPGDVIAIDPRQVVRAAPAPGSSDAEPDFFPLVELDSPDLPWSYSPAVASSARVLPWIVLVVIEDQPGVALVRGEGNRSPWILQLPADVARRELPNLADSWAWVHAQVACAGSDQIATALATQPDRTIARLMAARRLLPHRRYHACVVPAFRAGRIAGLGGDPAGDPGLVRGDEPAWSATDTPTELPVYHTWSFRTGEAGDFEALAQRLRPAPLDASIPAAPMQLALPQGSASLVVDWEGPLRVPGTTITRDRRPAAAVAQIRDSLKAGSDPPVLGPSYFGSSWLEERALDPLTAWAPEVNLTPVHRAAAGLGAEAVRGEQDSLVAAASAQLDAYRKSQQDGRRQQLSMSIVNRVKARLTNAPATESARVFSPVMAVTQWGALNYGMFTAAGRRITRKTWQARAVLLTPTAPAPPVAAIGTFAAAPIGAAPVAPAPPAAPGTIPALTFTAAELEEAPVLIPEIVYPRSLSRIAMIPAPLPVPVDPTTIADGTFAPRFARPMSEPLAERFPELMVPGFGSIPGDGVLLVESNPSFVEAYLLGANQELNYELLWRALPADRTATAFRRFWGNADGTDDVGAITQWTPASSLGSHVSAPAAMVLLVRGEIVRRYPSMTIAAVPAAWNRVDGTRSAVTDPSKLVLPAFRGRIGADVLFAGFSRPTLADAVGSPTPAGPAGWFLVLSENPADPRFGLDPDAGGAPPTRQNLSWTHLSLPPDATYAPVSKFPVVTDAAFSPATATAATMANLVRQRAFRVFLHASLLVRAPA